MKPTAINNEGMQIIIHSEVDVNNIEQDPIRAFVDGLPIANETSVTLKYGFIEEEISACYVAEIEAIERVFDPAPPFRRISELKQGDIVKFAVSTKGGDRVIYKDKFTSIGPIKMEVVGRGVISIEDTRLAYATLKQVP